MKETVNENSVVKVLVTNNTGMTFLRHKIRVASLREAEVQPQEFFLQARLALDLVDFCNSKNQPGLHAELAEVEEGNDGELEPLTDTDLTGSNAAVDALNLPGADASTVTGPAPTGAETLTGTAVNTDTAALETTGPTATTEQLTDTGLTGSGVVVEGSVVPGAETAAAPAPAAADSEKPAPEAPAPETQVSADATEAAPAPAADKKTTTRNKAKG